MTASSSIDRRRFLELTAGGIAGLAGASLLGTAGASVAHAASAFSLNLQLSWLKTVEFGGSYMAQQKGYYAAKKVAVTLLAGGPSVDPSPLIANGKAFIGLTGLDQVAQAIDQGAPLKVVGVLFQKNPFCVVSRASKPITKPTDLYGKKIGVAAGNSTAWKTFLTLNKLDVSKITVEPAQFDPTPVATGEFDGQVVFVDNEVIQLQQKGLKTATLLFEDFNYHLVTDVYVVNTSTLSSKTKRAALVRFMKADLKGWQDAIAHPGATASLTVDVFAKGTGLDLPQQVGEAKAQVPLIFDSFARRHGIGYFTKESLASDFKTLATSGIKASPSIVDDSIIAEVYGGKNRIS